MSTPTSLQTLRAMTRQGLISMARHSFAGQVPPAAWASTPGVTKSVLVEILHTGTIPPPLEAALTGQGLSASTVPTPAATPAAAGGLDLGIIDLAIKQAIREALEAHKPTSGVDEAEVRRILLEELGNIIAPRRVKVVKQSKVDITIDNAHMKFEDALTAAQACMDGHTRDGLYFYGPVGTGKTHMAKQISDALEAEFYSISLCQTTSEARILGHTDAHGNYHPTPTYEAWKRATSGKRAVLCFDEFDNGSPSILPVLNTALGNGWLTFPDGSRLEITKDLVFIATANTIGEGATLEHIGRMKQDKATLDRFMFVRVDIDEELEKAVAFGLDSKWGPYWAARVQAWRQGVEKMSMRHILSPRATFGAVAITKQALANGRTEKQAVKLAEELRVWQALDRAQIRKVKNASPEPVEVTRG